MKKKDLEHFGKLLQEEKARILNQAAPLQDKELALSADDLADEVDLASSELNQSVVMRLRDRERILLQKIEVALAKIESGSFGVCDSCEEPIEVKRLQARPVANLCIGCKETEEKQEKGFANS